MMFEMVFDMTIEMILAMSASSMMMKGIKVTRQRRRVSKILHEMYVTIQ